MKTWNKPALNELDVMMTMSGTTSDTDEATVIANYQGKGQLVYDPVSKTFSGNGPVNKANAELGAAHS